MNSSGSGLLAQVFSPINRPMMELLSSSSKGRTEIGSGFLSSLARILTLGILLVHQVTCSAVAHEFWFDAAPHGPHLPAEKKSLRVDLDFQNAEAVYALKCLAEDLGFNIIVSPRFFGKVNIVARNVPAEEAFRLLLAGDLEQFEVRYYKPHSLVVGFPGELDEIAYGIPGPPEWVRDEPVSIRLENMLPTMMAEFLQHEFPDCKLSFESEGRVLHITGRNLQTVKFDARVMDQHFYNYYCR